MPSYNTSPFAAIPQKLIPGQPAYLFGSWPSDVAPTRLHVSNVALVTNVATLTVQVTAGNIPVVGALISVKGTATASGAFNVANVALTDVTLDANGAGTVSFALTHADVTATADGGVALIPQLQVSEAVANGASVAVGLPYAAPSGDSGQGSLTINCEVDFPTLPTACVVALEGALVNQDSSYQTIIANVVTVATSARTNGTLSYTGKVNFVRYKISGTSGSGKIAAKVGL